MEADSAAGYPSSPSQKIRLVEWKSIFCHEHDHDHKDVAPDPITGSSATMALADAWEDVRVPHNWEHYHGYHEVSHGNLHGTAWYRTSFERGDESERIYAFFEGVGSYATVYCNGHPVGEHAGGRTTFTVDLTAALCPGSNMLTVRAHHPSMIDDLPFVCGGCWGSPNTEGSQPLGIFRPAWLERTGPVRVEPFGQHVLTPEISSQHAVIEVRTEIRNATAQIQEVLLETAIFDPQSHRIFTRTQRLHLMPKELRVVQQIFPQLAYPRLWEPENPALYRARAILSTSQGVSHTTETTFGLRWLDWPDILQPHVDLNVTSPDRRGNTISSGIAERSAENNGLTNVTVRNAAPARVAPMGVAIRLSDLQQVHDQDPRQAINSLPEVAALEVGIAFQSSAATNARLWCEIQNEGGTIFLQQLREDLDLPCGSTHYHWKVPQISRPRLWTESDPCLHRLIVELRGANGDLWERSETLFGIRECTSAGDTLNLERPLPAPDTRTPAHDSENRILRLNGRPLFLNGTCEYETLLGGDHAFSDEQIAARVSMMRSAGFNAFRDAHHPHNLRYYDHWDKAGIVCWTQMGSNIWFDSQQFRDNYRQLTREWVRERRNHPCIILWGLQNESALPEDFAMEIREIIRELDPTSPRWRLTTTCNGGKGSDWNVPQEWSGTYGGNYNNYNLKSLQLVGEYGAWRAFGTHTETEEYMGDENDRSESWACQAMETKIRLGEASRDCAIGHFHWLFNSFPNPGRAANNFEGPGNAQIGAINNKGLVTAWDQPSDLYYLYRANYADPARNPMVYIVSHTWPERWKTPGKRTIRVYSNCAEVELFNGSVSLGIRKNPGRGRHFQWQGVELRTNRLRAVARNSQLSDVAEDIIQFDYLPDEPDTRNLRAHQSRHILKADEAGIGHPALFRINCGATEKLIDSDGRHWSADTLWQEGSTSGSESWGRQFENIPEDLASRGITTMPVTSSPMEPHFPQIYQHYRFGRQFLRYHLRTGPGLFRVVCHYAEPWYGIGGGVDCTGWRLFDVAVNGKRVDTDLDVWAESSGHHRVLIKNYDVEIDTEILTLHFPRTAASQAIIFAIECFRRI
ncbi:MAG TPA: malectin domain-containing carbohydrate-binding protein [Candidatus Methylacidiphilales bacterium]|nr:malectin domain-containing carbohydrate-binding protein [Candidatus Methylacidiphilales bacterium]